jgi:hypothetical protein
MADILVELQNNPEAAGAPRLAQSPSIARSPLATTAASRVVENPTWLKRWQPE